jgi:Lamin Tail Domain/Secretion system C-terminal sorting domain/Bacterial Ig-like domain
MFMKKLYMLFMALLPALVWGQVSWNFGTAAPGQASPSSGGTIANIASISDVSQGNNNGVTPLLSTTSASSGYTGATGSFNAGAAARTGALATGANGSAYFEFTVTPAAGFAVVISQIDFGTRSTGTGPQAYSVRSSLDNYAADLAAGTIGNNSTWSLKTNSLSFSGTAGTAVTLRIYGHSGAGSAATNTANWRVDDLAVTVAASNGGGTSPSIAVNAAGLTNFAATAGTASPAQTITVGGTNLTSDISVTPPVPYEISIDNGATYSATAVTLPQTGGTVAATTVNIRIAATGPAGAANGNLTAASAGATTQTVALSGTVTSAVTVDPPGSFTAAAISTTQIDLSGTGNAAGNNILVATNSSASFGAPGGALVAGNTLSGGGTVIYNGPSAGFSFQHTGLTPGTAYFYKAWSVDASNNYSAAALTATATTVSLPVARVVINQVYGGGGNSGAAYKNDFIELFNNEDTAVNLAGWSVQYAGPTGNSYNVHAISGIVPPHSFFLIQEAAGTGGTLSLPAPDASGPLAMGASNGKVMLSNRATGLSSTDPSGPGVVDKVGYGTANGFETAPAAATDNTTSVTRIADGADNNNNATDFAVGAPNPRNSGYTTTPPGIFALTPPNASADVPYNISLSILFDKKVLKGTGTITVYENGVAGTPLDVNDASVILNTNNSVSFPSVLQPGKSYYVLVSAGAFKDVYNNSFAGITTTNGWAFTTYSNATGIAVPVSFDFQACTGSGLLPNGFTQFSETGNQRWDCTAFGRDPANPAATAAFPNGVQMNGFDNALGNVINTDWLISPALDLTGTTYPLLSFYSRTRFNGAPLQLKVSANYTGTGDPNLATWTDLNGKFAPSTSDTWTLSSNINLSNFKQPKLYIAFVYTSTNDDGARWTLDDISVINSATPPPPSLTLSTNSIEFFYAAAGSSVTKQFTVIGNDLTGGAGINISATGSFEVSKDNTSFGTAINFTEAEANNIAKTVYVKFAPAQNNQNFTGNVTLSTPGVTDTLVGLKGTSIDPARTLEVVNWNMEWFGSSDPTLGPGNKAQQKLNAQVILPSLGADLYALVEVVDTAALANIVRTAMPGYNYVICNYGSHSNPFEPGFSPIGQLQKEAFVYKTSVFSNVDTASLLNPGVNTLADLSNPNYNYWASGRYPFMLTADVTLDGVVKKVHFIAVHAKANTSPTVTSYDRRKNGAIALHDYLNITYPNDNIVILGDFNDDLDSTITDGIAPRYSSYKVFTDDAPAFSSPTLTGLSLTGKKSTISYNDVIDHVVVSNEMKPLFMSNSAAVLTDVTSLVANYGSTTSDHYPIFTRFAFDAALLPVKLVSFTAVREDNTVKLRWKSAEELNSREYIVQRSADGLNFSSIGTVAAKGAAAEYILVDAHPVAGDNYYRLKPVDLDGKFIYSKVVKINFGRLPAIRISPNPASNWLYISMENINTTVNLQLMDANGQLVKQQLITQGTANKAISLSGLVKGMYTVKLVSKELVTTKKLVIQ